jgi:hypothetical protein
VHILQNFVPFCFHQFCQLLKIEAMFKAMGKMYTLYVDKKKEKKNCWSKPFTLEIKGKWFKGCTAKFES